MTVFLVAPAFRPGDINMSSLALAKIGLKVAEFGYSTKVVSGE